MDEQSLNETHSDLVPREVDIEPMPREHLLRTEHQPYAAAHPGWKSYASQTHIVDMALDVSRGWLWMATWGGILSWDAEAQSCIRHASAHGLLGNATRSILVDHSGIVWAGGQKHGLCYLEPGSDRGWQSHSDVLGWKVQCLVSRDEGGVYVALQAPGGLSKLAKITGPNAEISILCDGGLAIKSVYALYNVGDDGLWLGNPWGLHCYSDGEITSYEFVDDDRTRIHVHAIAQSPDGWLWIGTQHGLYRFQTEKECPFDQQEGWPRDTVFDLAVEPESGELWCLTASEAGRVYDGTWQPAFQMPPGRLNKLITVQEELKTTHPDSPLCLPQGQLWLGSASGLYKVGLDGYEDVFRYTTEDALSNAIQALWADTSGIWVGSARGLYHFDGEKWKDYRQDEPDLRDVRAIAPGIKPGQLWIGSWRLGLQRLQQGVFIPGQILSQPIVALATGEDDSMWAATIDTVYWRSPDSDQGQPLPQSISSQLAGAIIQTISHQLATAPGGTESTLWVGTSHGLLYYRPDRETWNREPALEGRNIQALTVDKYTNRLWVGTQTGLFRESTWRCCRAANVTALGSVQIERLC